VSQKLKRTSIGQSFDEFCAANNIACECNPGKLMSPWNHSASCAQAIALGSWRQLGADLLGIPSINSPCPTISQYD